MAENSAPNGKPDAERVVIQKYANRRLYNKASSTYITLEDLAKMVKEGVDFVVYDAKTNEDITRKVLTQIVFEEESSGQNLLPIQFLRQLIGFYGNSMQAFLPSYLEMSLAGFAEQQERMRAQLATLGAPAGAGAFDAQVRQNIAMFDRAMKMFSPFAFPAPAATPPASPPPSKPAPAAPSADDALVELRKRMEEMQAQIEKLASKG